MGPTGAGKSTFIEALGWNGKQRISSNQLASFTQTVSTYRINNLTDHYCVYYEPIRLVDSPGFADTRISEYAIVSMLKKWLEDNPGVYFNRILYLMPITHPRLASSQRQVLKTFQAVTGIESSANITIVTTMWDSICSESALKRAEGTFQQLQDEIWKDYIDSGAQIVRFYNTLQSALSILNVVLDIGGPEYCHIETMVRNSQGFHQTPFGTQLYTDLRNRIQNLQSAQSTLHLDVQQAKLQNDAELYAVLIQQLQHIAEDVVRFQKELEDFGPPPCPTAAPQPTAPISSPISTLGEAQPVTYHDVIRPTVALTLPVTIVSCINGVDHPQRSRISRVLSSMKCWGNNVLEKHDDN